MSTWDLLALTTTTALLALPGVAAADPTPTCFGEPATIVSTTQDRDAIVEGTPGPDVIVVRGNAKVRSGRGDDRICGAPYVHAGPGDDRVAFHRDDYERTHNLRFRLGKGQDHLTMTAPFPASVAAGRGNDHVRTGRGMQAVIGQRGNDVIRTGPGHDTIVGGKGDDRLYGQGGNDEIAGAAGNDLLVGGPGDDWLQDINEKGRDVGRGGAGRDFCKGQIERPINCRTVLPRTSTEL